MYLFKYNLLTISLYTVFCIMLMNVYVYGVLFIIMIDYLTNKFITNNPLRKVNNKYTESKNHI